LDSDAWSFGIAKTPKAKSFGLCQVSDKEREEVGVHNKQPRRDQIPAPTTVPELEPRAGVPRQIVVDYRDKGSARRETPQVICTEFCGSSIPSAAFLTPHSHQTPPNMKHTRPAAKLPR
jgi:hypothetical protein